MLAVAQEKLGQKLNEGLIRAMGAFGGGLGASGNVCGNVIGALSVFGLIFSRSGEEEQENPMMWLYAQEFLRRFREEIVYGSILCHDIIGVDWMDQNQVKSFYKSEKRLECFRITGETAQIVGEMMERYQSQNEKRILVEEKRSI